jgi:hypothetical protein
MFTALPKAAPSAPPVACLVQPAAVGEPSCISEEAHSEDLDGEDCVLVCETVGTPTSIVNGQVSPNPATVCANKKIENSQGGKKPSRAANKTKNSPAATSGTNILAFFKKPASSGNQQVI